MRLRWIQARMPKPKAFGRHCAASLTESSLRAFLTPMTMPISRPCGSHGQPSPATRCYARLTHTTLSRQSKRCDDCPSHGAYTATADMERNHGTEDAALTLGFLSGPQSFWRVGRPVRQEVQMIRRERTDEKDRTFCQRPAWCELATTHLQRIKRGRLVFEVLSDVLSLGVNWNGAEPVEGQR